MNRHLINLIMLTVSLIGGMLSSCRQGPASLGTRDSLALPEAFATSPVLSPQQALQHFQIEKGFQIRLVAAEPLVSTPVAMSFDEKGRLWVVEMQGYMPDTAGTGEELPNGKIVILEDTNHDGAMDTRKLFLDSLVLPRALCLIGQGVLVAEPPRLWYVENHNGSAGKKILVDSAYAQGGNVEHQPNGLLRGLDNWIYSAKSAKRYRKTGDRWRIEHTHFRGQWGITQDDGGHLFYNTNSDNLLGDYFSPGLGADNIHQREVKGFDENIVLDNRTYPIRPTPGVNRGYMKGVLDDSLRLQHFTAACGPVIYRGGAFGVDYQGNAFVAEPAANLIKRNLLSAEGYLIKGRQAYAGREFLASTDERFRPVNLYNGPEGALYVVDMYRGVIQHKTYLTPYLKDQIKRRELEQPLNAGRIYRIVPVGKALPAPLIQTDPENVVNHLDDDNAWVREKAQQLIVDQHLQKAVPLLRKKLKKGKHLLGRVHALWALEGLGQLQSADLDLLLHEKEYLLREQALAAATAMLNPTNVRHWLLQVQQVFEKKDTLLFPHAAYLAASAMRHAPHAAQPLLLKMAVAAKQNKFIADAVISGLGKREAAFFQQFKAVEKDTNHVFYRHMQKVLENIEKDKRAHMSGGQPFARGRQLFESICQTCHGSDGNGVKALAPPLNGSNWVVGEKNKLLSIVLYGLVDPVMVSGKLYKTPEVGAEMPGIGNNDQLSDEDIAELLSFIRNAWTNKASPVTPVDVKEIRKKFKGRQQPFTMRELQ